MAHNNSLFIGVLAKDDSDRAELYDAASELRKGLLELDVDDVVTVSDDEVPEDSKSGAAELIGWLAVRLGVAGLRAVVARVAAMAQRHRTVIEISIGGDVLRISGASSAQQDRLVDAWLARHATDE